MPTLIALLQGINVVGNHKLPMKELSARLSDLEQAAQRIFAIAIDRKNGMDATSSRSRINVTQNRI
jgi:hypothetical protein